MRIRSGGSVRQGKHQDANTFTKTISPARRSVLENPGTSEPSTGGKSKSGIGSLITINGSSGRPLSESSCQRNTAATMRNAGTDARSEEHTSELQSLMRISYAVFCLKKKKEQTTKKSKNYTHEN